MSDGLFLPIYPPRQVWCGLVRDDGENEVVTAAGNLLGT